MRITKAGKGLLVFFTDSVPLKIAFSILIVVLLIPAIYHCYGAFRADRFVRYQPELAKYTRALESDPSNAQLWWNRGRFYHYSLSNIEIAQAARDYKKALSLNATIVWANTKKPKQQLKTRSSFADFLP
jgi:tetratricopeptide (TPR) repeat protein